MKIGITKRIVRTREIKYWYFKEWVGQYYFTYEKGRWIGLEVQ